MGVVYDRLHTREIARYGGLADGCRTTRSCSWCSRWPRRPTRNRGFVGEFLVVVGALQVNFWLALLGGMGMILGVAYMLYLYRRVIFGRADQARPAAMLDLSPREMAVFVPLVVLTLWMGVYPSSFTRFWDASVAAMVRQHTAALTTTRFAGGPVR